MNLSGSKPYIRYVALFAGLLLVFTPFQNCAIYESPDRKDLNANGFPSEGGCIPYITDAVAAQILGVEKAKTGFLPEEPSAPRKCSIIVPGTGSYGLGNWQCSIDVTNGTRARNRPTDVTLIGPNSNAAPLYYYSYARQDTEGSLKTYVITVGALEGRSEGISCGVVFDGAPETSQQNDAAMIGQDLVREMVNGTN
ncbi:MAG TPA: hypothetical protein VFV50_01350 [Bdellovibrionales bacterium]|nr:hypothetical protein [Bdellovibrionales bacterium]